MRAAGLNAVTTYVEWSLHNPKYGNYTWDGIADLERFIQLAAQEDLYVILRPGPYICAERDLVNMYSYKFMQNRHFSAPRMWFLLPKSFGGKNGNSFFWFSWFCFVLGFLGWASILAIKQISND